VGLKYAWRSFKHFVERHVRKNSEKASKFKTNVGERAGRLVERTIDNPDRVAVQERNLATGRPTRMNYEKEFNKEIGTNGETVVRANTQVKSSGEEVVGGYPQSGFTIKDAVGFLVGLIPGVALVDAVDVGIDAGRAGAESLEDMALEGDVGEHLRQVQEIDEIIQN
jgi:hypothetical protein